MDNHNVLKKTAELRKRLEGEGKEVALYVAGSKGLTYYNFRGEDIKGAWSGPPRIPLKAARTTYVVT